MSQKKKKTKKRSLFSKILALLLMLTGIGVIPYPTISDMVVNYKLSQKIADYNTALEGEEENFDEFWRAAEEYNRYLASRNLPLTISPEEREYVETLLNPMGTGMIGSIEIPKIGVNIPIYYGTDEKQLQAGAGFWMGSSLPVGGPDTHAVLTAHTGLVRAKLFTDLDQLQNGDQFFIKVLDRVLAYEVDQRQVVDPDVLEPMYIQPGQDLVTLYTCYPYGVNTHRLLVRGHRIPYEEQLENEENQIVELAKNYGLYLLIIPVLLFLWWLRRLLKRRKKKKSEKPTPIAVDLIAAEKPKPGPWTRKVPVYLRKRHLKTRLMHPAVQNKDQLEKDDRTLRRKQRPHSQVPFDKKAERHQEWQKKVTKKPTDPKAGKPGGKALGKP